MRIDSSPTSPPFSDGKQHNTQGQAIGPSIKPGRAFQDRGAFNSSPALHPKAAKSQPNTTPDAYSSQPVKPSSDASTASGLPDDISSAKPWDPNQSYKRGDIISYQGAYFRLTDDLDPSLPPDRNPQFSRAILDQDAPPGPFSINQQDLANPDPSSPVRITNPRQANIREWEPGRNYQAGSIVSWQGNYYVNKKDVISVPSPQESSGPFERISGNAPVNVVGYPSPEAAGLTFKPWNSWTDYKKGDLIQHNGNIYRQETDTPTHKGGIGSQLETGEIVQVGADNTYDPELIRRANERIAHAIHQVIGDMNQALKVLDKPLTPDMRKKMENILHDDLSSPEKVERVKTVINRVLFSLTNAFNPDGQSINTDVVEAYNQNTGLINGFYSPETSKVEINASAISGMTDDRLGRLLAHEFHHKAFGTPDKWYGKDPEESAPIGPVYERNFANAIDNATSVSDTILALIGKPFG